MSVEGSAERKRDFTREKYVISYGKRKSPKRVDITSKEATCVYL